jgi:hypothetical protein
MAYREVTTLEVKEVLRPWLGGIARKRIAAQLGLNVKTVRRYIAAAEASSVTREASPEARADDLIAAVVSRVSPTGAGPRATTGPSARLTGRSSSASSSGASDSRSCASSSLTQLLVGAIVGLAV